DGRVQSAGDFEQEPIRLPAAKDLDNRWQQIFTFDGFKDVLIIARVEKENATQAGLPLDAVEHGRHLVPRLASKVDDDQLVEHGDILKKPRFRLSSVCHKKRNFSQGCDEDH